MYDDILGEALPKKPKQPTGKRGKANRPILRQMTGDEIKALKDGDDNDYFVKLTRLYDPKPVMQWKGKVKLHIQEMKGGGIGVLTPKPDSLPKGQTWAEYCQSDIEDDGKCVCEDYLMEIWKEIK